MTATPTTKPGKHGLLYLHEIEYTDVSGENPVFRTRLWGYTREHALERFHDSDDDGWIALRIARVTSKPRHSWNWHSGPYF